MQMREPLRIAVVQPYCVGYDVAANAATHATTIRAADARVVVFPEVSLTGYNLDAATVSLDDPALVPIVWACAATNSVALVGAPVPGPHIAVLAIDARGVSVAYRKMWLSGAEAERFIPGDQPAAIDVDGWRIGLAICKDTGIAQHAADTAALGIDIYAAGTVKSPGESAVQDERAQRVATDHGVWVAVASFAGSTGGGFTEAAGRSGIWSPDGKPVTRAGTEIGAIARAIVT